MTRKAFSAGNLRYLSSASCIGTSCFPYYRSGTGKKGVGRGVPLLVLFGGRNRDEGVALVGWGIQQHRLTGMPFTLSSAGTSGRSGLVLLLYSDSMATSTTKGRGGGEMVV